MAIVAIDVGKEGGRLKELGVLAGTGVLNAITAADIPQCVNYAHTHRSHPRSAAMPTSAGLSSARRLLPFPGAVSARSVLRISLATGRAGCVALGKRCASSCKDMVGGR